MKVNLNVTTPRTLSFKGFEHKKADDGTREYQFNYPHDENKYDVYLEVFSVKKDKDANYNVSKMLTNNETGAKSVKIGRGGVKIDMAYAYDDLSSNEPFAYRYKVVDKRDQSKSFYQVDAGSVIDYSKNGNFDKFNLVMQNGTNVSKGGSMLLALPDSYSVGWVYNEDGKPKLDKDIQAKAAKSTKTFSNKLGGNLAGFEANIDKLKQAGYSRVVSTPIFTDDSLSSHSYWNKNCMQMSNSIGNVDNYRTFQEKMFKNGMNFVSDGAFVNEGLEGVHFKHVLKWGEQSPYYNWFRASGLQSGPLSMGVFPKNQEFVGHKVVNSPYKYEQDKATGEIKISKNEKYNSKKPTFVQIYDKRLVSEEQKNDSTKLIKAYDKLDTGNPLEINNHNDTVIPYSFEIRPETYNDNVKKLNKYNKNQENDKKIKMDSPIGAKFLTTSTSFVLEDKFENGFETWDANTDIAKLNFVFSHADTKRLNNLPLHEREYQTKQIKAKNFEAQDYVVASGRYWTNKTANILNEYVSKNLKNVDKNAEKTLKSIYKLADEGQLPKSVKEEVSLPVVQNVLNGRYESKTSKLPSDYKELMTKSLMDLPLDSIELADDTVAVLSSSFMTNRATKSELVGKTRYELHKENNPQLTEENKSVYEKTNKFYTEELSSFANEIMDKVNAKLPENAKLTKNGKATKMAKYVLPLVAGDIVKFAVIKSVKPDAKVKTLEDGNLSYDYNKLKEDATLESMGILADSPKNEATELLSKLKSGVKHISNSDKDVLTNSILRRLEGKDENTFALSEMIVDRTNAGLDWRIDAAKDIADMDALRNGNSNFSESWSNVINFWHNFSKAVVEENKNAYMVAEVTDEYALHDNSGKYSSAKDAVMKLHQEAGMTSIANYSYFFTDVANLFNKDITTGVSIDQNTRSRKIFDKMVGGDNYLNSAPLDSILYSYTFVGNHDKPRMLHTLSLDMELFHTNFNNNYNHKKIATAILKDKMYNEVTDADVNSINFNHVNNKAIAMADALKGGFGKALGKVFQPSQRKDEVFSSISKSIADLASGKYLDKQFSADAFGTKPFDVAIKTVLKQATEKHGLNLSKEEKGKLYNATFETILKPGMSKFKAMMGFLVSLPGNPTMYAGDELGVTGYDEKAKNVYLNNRSFLHWEWLNDGNKKFIQDFYKDMNETMALREKPELRALNNGTPYTLDLHKSTTGANIPVIARQSADGAMAITLFNANGVNLDKEAELHTPHVKLDSISFHTTGNDKVGLKAGLTEGMTFKNADQRDKSVYKVCEECGNYFIKRFDSEQAYNHFLASGKKFTDSNRIDMYNSTLILYSVPEKQNLSFKGSKVMYNPQYNFVSNPYQQVKNVETGSKFTAIAK